MVLTAVLAPGARAQRVMRIGYIYPAGGRQGTEFTVTLGGQHLEGAGNAHFSGTGVRAVVLRHDRQVTPAEQNELTEKLELLRAKRGKEGLTPDEEMQTGEIRRKLTGYGRRLVNPALNEFITLQVTVAADAEPGRREIRLGTPVGLSNPLVFVVGQLPEFTKPDWKNIPKSRESMDPECSPVPNELTVTLPVTLNGQIQPGGVDRFRFQAEGGRRLSIMFKARELIPFLADAVPGWIVPKLTLFDAQGNELPCEDDGGVHPDPSLLRTIPATGEYVLEVRDALYRGREDFVYRISMGDLPVPERAIPPPAATTEALPEITAADGPRTVTLPVIINGCIRQPGDTAVFRFEGRAGQQIVAEVRARRLDSPLDSLLQIKDAGGRQLGVNDDHEDKSSGLDTHHADSYLLLTLPVDGTYFVHLADAQGKGGPAHAYRLRLSGPRPDFELRAVPSTLNVRAGTSVPMKVYVLRKDGFSGGIGVALKDAPSGFSLTGARVPENQDQVQITLTAPPSSAAGPFNLSLEGRADIGGREVVREVVPADVMMQAFSYRHIVPAEELKVAVWGRAPERAQGKILSATPLKIPAGGTARVEVEVPAPPMEGQITFALDNAPDGIALGPSTPDVLMIETDAAKAKPGLAGNLIVEVFLQRSGADVPANKRRVPLGALPAIPFEIVTP
jgi:hypothetical protein